MPAGVVMVHAVENGCLVFGELPVAEVVLQRREAGEGVLTRMSLLLAEADSFVRPQYLRAGKVLNLGGRAVWRGREERWDQSWQRSATPAAGRALCVP